MSRKLTAMILAIALLFASAISAAESESAEKEELDSFMENLEKTASSFVLPLNIGPIYSVIVRKDSIGVVFNLIRSKSVSSGLEGLSFIADLKEVEVFLNNGMQYKIPAVVQILSQEVGTFIVMHLSPQAAESVATIIMSGAQIVRFDFTQNDGRHIPMTVDEVNKALTDATGQVTDLASQAGQALSAFWQSLSDRAGVFANDAYAGIGSALVSAGDFFAETAAGIGDSITDAFNSAGDFIGNTADAAGEAIGNAAEEIGNFFNGLFGK